MTHKASIDGENKLITISAGVTTIDVEQDLYSAWKSSIISGQNIKFAPAFRTVGGDVLGEGLEAGAFFFLQNQSGSAWRIKPPEESTEIKFIGNLYPEDASSAIFIPTTGSNTVLMTIERSSLTQAAITSPNQIWNLEPYSDHHTTFGQPESLMEMFIHCHNALTRGKIR